MAVYLCILRFWPPSKGTGRASGTQERKLLPARPAMIRSPKPRWRPCAAASIVAAHSATLLGATGQCVDWGWNPPSDRRADQKGLESVPDTFYLPPSDRRADQKGLESVPDSFYLPATADCGAFFKSFQGTLTATPPNTPRGPITVNLTQDHPATPGMKYILTGWAGAGTAHIAVGHELAIDFLDSLGDVIPLAGSANPLAELFVDNGLAFDYKEYMTMAVAPANAVEIRARISMLEGSANPMGGDQAFVVDDITLICIPEPASVALGMIGVLGLIGLVRRR